MKRSVHLYSIAPRFSVLFTLLLLAACGGKGEDNVPESLVVHSAAVQSWPENSPLEFKVQAVGQGRLEYYLRESPDSGLFELNESTGVLKAGFVADFENPVDANKDGVYALDVIVIDASQSIVSQTINITVTNTEELAAKVVFPIEGANIGGFESTMTFRGSFTLEGAPVDTVSDSISVRVNGVDASLIEGAKWSVKAPVNLGTTEALIEVLDNGVVQSQVSYPIENRPVRPSSAGATDWQDNVYFVGVGGRTVSRFTESTSVTETLLWAGDDIIKEYCDSFAELSLSPNSDYLLIGCTGTVHGSTLAVLDLETNSVNFPGVSDPDLNFSQWTSDDRVIVRTSESYTWLDAASTERRDFKAAIGGSTSTYDRFVYDNGTFVKTRLFSEPGGLYVEYYLEEFDFYDLIEGETTIVPLDEYGRVEKPSETEVSDRSPFLVVNDELLVAGDTQILRVDPLEGTVSTYADISALGRPPRSFVALADDSFGIVSRNGAIHTLTGEALSSRLFYQPQAVSIGRLSFSPNGGQIMNFSQSMKQLSFIDAFNFSVTRDVDLSTVYEGFDFNFVFADFDWQSEQFFSASINWAGFDADVGPIVSSIDLQTLESVPLLSADDLHGYLNGADARYTLGNIVYDASLDSLWLAVGTYNDFGSATEGVYLLDVKSHTLSTVYEYTLAEGEQPDVLILSGSCGHGGTVVLSSWKRGRLELISSNGEVRTVLSPGEPFDELRFAIWVPDENALYGLGNTLVEDDVRPGTYPQMEYFRYDLDRDVREVFTENSDGPGVLPLSTAFDYGYDENRQLFFDGFGAELLVIDSQSGDRVVAPVSPLKESE